MRFTTSTVELGTVARLMAELKIIDAFRLKSRLYKHRLHLIFI